MKSFKRYYIIRMVLTTLFIALAGVFFLLMEPYSAELFDILVIAMGLLTACFNLPGVIQSIRYIRQKGMWVNLLLASCAVVLGILLMLLQRTVLLIPLGVYSLCMPLLRICLVQERKKQLARELPVMVAGLTMIIISLTQSEDLVLRVLAVLCFAIAALYLLHGLFELKFRFEKTEE